MRALSQIVCAVVVAFPGLRAIAQQPKIGEAAPPITLSTWLNVEAGKAPTLESLHGRVVMLEFWGTWCAPCVRAMPEVQKLHDRYRERGLTVLAISYEAPEAMKPFLVQNGYTMVVGSDPEKKVVTAYGIRGWPSTYVIDKDGKLAYVGDPYSAEAAVEKALGVESSPATLLTTWLETLKDTDKQNQREAIKRLLEKASPDFDLAAWARANGGAEEAATAPEGDGKPATAAAAHAPAVDGADLLRKCIAAWNGKDPKQQKDLLRKLGDGGPAAFDLAAFVRDAYAKAWPLDNKELQALVQEKKFADAIDAIVNRNPPAPVLAAASKDAKLREYCRSKSSDMRDLAKKGVMIQGWVFSGVQPKDNEGFWKELSVSGMAFTPDHKQITGVLLAGANVTKAMAEGFTTSHFAQAIVMEALAAGHTPQLKNIDKQIATERQRVLKPLEDHYGPVADKKK
ncbi:MAG TPA: TlpA disulfide reductase family protein [Planctomycetota bacterium]|nr:TlpA disulfide reductase family protein [Planctomycetota bacterium]